MIEFLITLLIFVIIVCFVIWLIGQIPGVPPWVRAAVIGICAIIFLIWILEHFAGHAVGL